MTTPDIVALEKIPGIGPAESQSLATEGNALLIATLTDLAPDEWNKITVCEPWTVKDIAAHLLGWAEALGSFREMRSQVGRAVRRRKELGNPTDAQNHIQVEDRKDLSPQEIVGRLEAAFPTAVRTRRRLGTVLRYVPVYTGYLGGLTNLGYVANVIFIRDLLVHRLDIADATGNDPHLGAADRRIATDMLKDWARRSKADVRIELSGPLAGSFQAREGAVGIIHSDGAEFTKLLCGRADRSVVKIEGDDAAIERWLAVRCPV